MRRLAAPLLLLSACGMTQMPVEPLPPRPPAPPSVFPTAETVQQLATAPVTLPVWTAVDVPVWQLTGPFPTAIDAAPAALPAPWDTFFPGATWTSDLACVARELAAFYLEHRDHPTDPLLRAIGGWCGSASLDWGRLVLSIEVPAHVGEAEIASRWAGKVRQMAAQLPAGTPIGVAFVRKGKSVVLLATWGMAQARLGLSDLTPGPDGRVKLSGEVLHPVESLRVLVNQGRLAVAECALDRSVQLPRFVASCPIVDGDATAWIGVSATAPGRVIGDEVLSVLARRPGATPLYSTPDLAIAGDQAIGMDALASSLNVVRRAAGLAPLAVVVAESDTAARLAPHFFAARLAHDSGVTDQIALGLLAGWNTGSPVTSASFYSSWSRASDARQLVMSVIDRPLARAALFDPDATHLAVGGFHDEKAGGAGALFVTYTGLGSDTAAASARMVAAVKAARAAKGLPAPRVITSLSGAMKDTAEQLGDGRLWPEAALQRILELTVRTLERDARGYVLAGSSLADVPFPAEVLTPGEVSLLVLAAPYRPENQPWWRWVVVIVVVPR